VTKNIIDYIGFT